MNDLEKDLTTMFFWEKDDGLWTTRTTKVFFRDLYDGWYIGIIVNIEKEEIIMSFVRNDYPPKVYQDFEFETILDIRNQYNITLESLKKYEPRTRD